MTDHDATGARRAPDVQLHLGDCRDIFGALAPNTLDAILADPPAGIAFMGRAWDSDRGGRAAWVEWLAGCLAPAVRALKPGRWALIWALPRTAHWTACAVEDAGLVITDQIVHLFGQGWPKNRGLLKPGQETWILARKPYRNAREREEFGDCPLHVDACRVPRGDSLVRPPVNRSGYVTRGNVIGAGRQDEPGGSWPTNALLSHDDACEPRGVRRVKSRAPSEGHAPTTRHAYGAPSARSLVSHADADGLESVPVYACLAGCDCGAASLAEAGGEPSPCPACGSDTRMWACPVAELDRQSGDRRSGARREGVRKGLGYGSSADGDGGPTIEASHGGASRFFPTFGYHAKAPSAERHAGCDHLLWRRNDDNAFGWDAVDDVTWAALPESERGSGNVHPTVKRLALVRWLARLIAAPGALVGVPFLGSGSEAIGAAIEGCSVIGAELAPEAHAIARARVAHWTGTGLDGLWLREPTREAHGSGTGAAPGAALAPVVRQLGLFG